MSQPDWILFWAAVLMGLLPTKWNPTCTALGANWFLTFGWWVWTGQGVAPQYAFYVDTLVLIVIICKAKRTWQDLLVALLFLPVWFAYGLHDLWAQYWLLFGLYLAQLAVADWGAFKVYLLRKAKPAETSDVASDQFGAPLWGWLGYG